MLTKIIKKFQIEKCIENNSNSIDLSKLDLQKKKEKEKRKF